MIVKFYILQKHSETGKTRNKFLYKAEHEEMMVGKQITHLQTKYQVNSLEWEDDVAGVLKAVCLEIPAHTK